MPVEPSTVIREYAGSGVLDFSDGTDSRCQFVARQYSNGDIILECLHDDHGAAHLIVGSGPPPTKFRGQTDGQRPLVIDGPFLTVHASIGSHQGTKTRHVCAQTELRLADEWSAEAIVTFDLTNLFLWPEEQRPRTDGPGTSGVIVLRVAGRELVLRRGPDHEGIREHLREHHGCAITASLETRVTGRDELDPVIAVVDRVCALLSLARGTLVTWLYYEIATQTREHISSYGRYAKTKDYCGSELIESNRRGETSGFVHQVYERYAEIEATFEMLRVIHARLDVNEGAFLEARGLVGAALVEYLASAYAREFGSVADRSASLTDKLALMCKALHGGFEAKEIRAVGRTRNHLAHRLRFASSDPYVEHSKLTNFLDVILLRLLGYSGPYVDCRTWERKVLQ